MANQKTEDGHGTLAGNRGGPAGGGGFPGFGAAPPAVASASNAGAAGTASRSDHTHAGVATVASGDNRIGVTTAAAIATLTQNIIANWTLGITRVYAVDGVNGNDANLGYADPASTSAADYVTACQLAGSRAKKTLAGLGRIIPALGSNRLFEIVIASGTYTDAIDTLLAGLSGYAYKSCLRGTKTDATAGVTAFGGSADDCTVAGAVTAAGMNATGYNADAATSATFVLTKVGGGSPAFAAEPALPLMMCLRGDVNNTTVATRNLCLTILAVNSANTVVVNQSVTRVAGDKFYIEDGGVVIPGGFLSDNAMVSGGLQSRDARGFQFVGVRWSGTVAMRGGQWQFSKGSGTTFAHADGPLSVQINDAAFGTPTYTHPVRGGLTTGGGVNLSGAVAIAGQNIFKTWGFAHRTANFQCSDAAIVQMTSSVVLGLQWQGGHVCDSNHSLGCGTPSTSLLPLRVLSPVTGRGGIDLETGGLGINGVAVTGAGALPAIKLFGSALVLNMSGDKHGTVSGTTGNTDVGLDLTQAYGCNIAWSIRPTVTGTLGDVRKSDGTIVSWATLAGAGTTVDTQGNRLSGP